MRHRHPPETPDHALAAAASGATELLEPSPGDRQPDDTAKGKAAIALIDPKPLTRQAVIEMLSRAFPGYRAVAVSSCDEYPDFEDAPQLVIVYIRSASVADGWVQNELRLARLRLTDVPLAMISDRDDADEVCMALSCGVRGYIPSSIPSTVALAALNLIYAGGTFIPEYALRPTASPARENDCGRSGALDELDLTARELSVVDLLREGKPNKRIAVELNMQESTVKVHVRNILKKLNSANRTQAASVANRLLTQRPPSNNGSAAR